jgi:hypothetical protein
MRQRSDAVSPQNVAQNCQNEAYFLKKLILSTITALTVSACTGLEPVEIPATLGGEPATGIINSNTRGPKYMTLNVLGQKTNCETKWRYDNFAQSLPLTVICADGRSGNGYATRPEGRFGAFNVHFTLNDNTTGTATLMPQ